MGWLLPQKDKDTTTQNYWRAVYARNFLQNDYWVGLGRKDTAWTYDDNPPDATVGTSPVEVLGYRQVQTKTLVVPDQENGSITWRSLNLTRVTDADMLQKTLGVYPRWAFLECTITTSELTTGENFRQVFLYTDLTPHPNWDTYEYLTPAQVSDPGNLIYIENIPAIYRLENQIEVISFLLEF
jgi:hypothetical protein